MIKYNLNCCNDHEFESWFLDSNEFDKLNKKNPWFLVKDFLSSSSFLPIVKPNNLIAIYIFH